MRNIGRGISSGLRSIDTQSQPVGFQFKQDYQNKSRTGAICTCIMIAIIVLTLIPIGQDLASGDYLDQTVSYQDNPQAENISVPLTKGFMFAIGISELDLRYERVFDFTLSRTAALKNQRNITQFMSQSNVKLIPCTQKAWNDLGLGQYYSTLTIQQMLCPDPKQIFKLTEDMGYRIQIERCTPQTLNPKFPDTNLTAVLKQLARQANSEAVRQQVAQKFDYKGYDSLDYTNNLYYSDTVINASIYDYWINNVANTTTTNSTTNSTTNLTTNSTAAYDSYYNSLTPNTYQNNYTYNQSLIYNCNKKFYFDGVNYCSDTCATGYKTLDNVTCQFDYCVYYTYKDNGRGICSDWCAAGYQDDGKGACVNTTLYCSTKKFKDNGYGECNDTCAQGYYDSGSDICTMNYCKDKLFLDTGFGFCGDSCDFGYKDNGKKICVDQAANCKSKYLDNGVGECSDTCAVGYQDWFGYCYNWGYRRLLQGNTTLYKTYDQLSCYYDGYLSYFKMPRQYNVLFYHVNTMINTKTNDAEKRFVDTREFLIEVDNVSAATIIRTEAIIEVASYQTTKYKNMVYKDKLTAQVKKGIMVEKTPVINSFVYHVSQTSKTPSGVKTNNFFTLDIRRSSQIKKVEIAIKTVLDIFSTIGGIAGFLIFVMGIFMLADYNQLKYELNVAKLFYQDVDKPIPTQKVNYFKFLLFRFYSFIRFFGCDPQWRIFKNCRRWYNLSQDVRKVLDIRSMLRKMNHFEKVGQTVLDEKKYKALYFQQPHTYKKMNEYYDIGLFYGDLRYQQLVEKNKTLDNLKDVMIRNSEDNNKQSVKNVTMNDQIQKNKQDQSPSKHLTVEQMGKLGLKEGMSIIDRRKPKENDNELQKIKKKDNSMILRDCIKHVKEQKQKGILFSQEVYDRIDPKIIQQAQRPIQNQSDKGGSAAHINYDQK